MILPLIVHYAEQGEREVDPYASWVAAIRQLRDDWKDQKEPQVPQLRDYLREIAANDAPEALLDLIAEHMRLSWQAGRGTCLESYLEMFGGEFEELACSAAVPADLVEDEFLARYSLPHGDMPLVAEYEARFPARVDVIEPLQQRCLGSGRYVKLRKLGQGAMGDIWEAHDHHLCRRVAIKEPKPDLAQHPEILRRFAEEARVTAGLEHTSIVTVHEYEQQSGDTPFYVMRLVNGQTLGEQIRDYHQPQFERSAVESSLLWHRLLQSFVAVCDVVAYAHAHQVLHRDLKPGNVLVGEFGETVTLDWGMARRMPAGTPAPAAGEATVPERANAAGQANPTPPDELPARTVEGTPQYMAPEQADGVSDARSDVFGLGAILYEILASRPPHDWPDGFPPAEWQRLVREAQFPKPRQLNPRAPKALEAICLKALQREPATRYQRADEMAQDMRRYLAGESVTAWSEPFLVRSWRKLRRSRP